MTDRPPASQTTSYRTCERCLRILPVSQDCACNASGKTTEDTGDIIDRINAACVGHPHARISWPHRLLHDARGEIEGLRERVRWYAGMLSRTEISAAIEEEIANAKAGE